MFVEFRVPREYGQTTAKISIKNLKIGSVVQRTTGEGESLKHIDCYGHIVGFSRVDGKLAMEVKWDSSPVTSIEMPEYLVLL